MKRDRLVHTFGVLLAGLFEAEKNARQREARRQARPGSGVYRLRAPKRSLPRLSEPPPF